MLLLKKIKNLKQILVLAFLLKFALAFWVWHPDLNNHIDWGKRFWEYGPEYFYKANVWNFTWPNQPPGTIYIFAIIRKFYELVFSGLWYLNVQIPAFPSNIMFFLEKNMYPAFLKLPSLLSDIGIAYLIYKLLEEFGNNKFLENFGKKSLGLFGAILFLVNPVIWYNSAVWGQTDSIINFLSLLSFYLLFKKRLILAVVILSLCFYVKASLLIFAPVFVIFALRQRYKLSNYLFSVVVALVVIGALTLPFAKGDPYGWLLEIYENKVFKQQLHVITANAFNLWAAIAGIHERPHSTLLGPLTYDLWGKIAFTLAYLPALFLVYKKQDLKSLIWSLTITAFASFMLLTNMHERYLYPLFPVMTILVAMDKKLLSLYLAISFIHLLNLYNFWWTPRINPVVEFLSFGDRLMPRILGLINFGLFIFLYKKFFSEIRTSKVK